MTTGINCKATRLDIFFNFGQQRYILSIAKQMIGTKIIKVDSVDSTNTYLNKLVKNTDIEEGTVVIASEQIAGRGQFGNSWESKKGDNLLLSYIVHPVFLQAENQFMISKAVALGILDFLANYVENVKIKWPNDIYVGNKKITGILIENALCGSSISSSIVGIGININQTGFSNKLPNPTSLKLETGNYYNLEQLSLQLFKYQSYWYQLLKDGQHTSIDKAYLNGLYQLGEYCQYKDDKGGFIAKIIDIEKTGRLCMVDKNGTLRKYFFKEVQFL